MPLASSPLARDRYVAQVYGAVPCSGLDADNAVDEGARGVDASAHGANADVALALMFGVDAVGIRAARRDSYVAQVDGAVPCSGLGADNAVDEGPRGFDATAIGFDQQVAGSGFLMDYRVCRIARRRDGSIPQGQDAVALAPAPAMVGVDAVGIRAARGDSYIAQVDGTASRAVGMVAENAIGVGTHGVDATAHGAKADVASSGVPKPDADTAIALHPDGRAPDCGVNVALARVETQNAGGSDAGRRDRSSIQVQPDPARRADVPYQIAMCIRAGARHIGGGGDRDVARVGGIPWDGHHCTVPVKPRGIEVAQVQLVIGIAAVVRHRRTVDEADCEIAIRPPGTVENVAACRRIVVRRCALDHHAGPGRPALVGRPCRAADRKRRGKGGKGSRDDDKQTPPHWIRTLRPCEGQQSSYNSKRFHE